MKATMFVLYLSMLNDTLRYFMLFNMGIRYIHELNSCKAQLFNKVDIYISCIAIEMDITYITDKVAIMGSFYENDSLNEIRAHMKSRHDKHHTIYNVSSEPEYNIEQDIDNVRNFPFNANNPCALKTLIAICCDMEAYLNVNANNVIFIHCRTGTKYNFI